jgi:hypothetical protein
VITILKQWLQDWLPQVLGQSGNFEIIVFGLLLLLILHRAREGMWPALLQLFRVKAAPKVVVEGAAALPLQSAVITFSAAKKMHPQSSCIKIGPSLKVLPVNTFFIF